MVSVEGASAVEPAKIHNIPNLNNFSGTADDEEKLTAADPLIARPIVIVAPKQYLSPESVCQTAGFINSQNQQVVKFPSNVRFVVHPVAEDEIRKADVEPHGESRSCHLSAQSFTFSGGHSSADDINGHYSFWGSDPQAQLTVRSMASIGLGSSNGRKIHLRRVHTTGHDLVSPLLLSPNGEAIQPPWAFSTTTKNVSGMLDGPVDDGSSSDESYSDTRKNRHKQRSRHRHSARTDRHTGQTWGSKVEFLLACVGFAAGLSNIWRFPYTAFKSGGGAFLVPYCIMVFLCGIPMQILELAVGQYTREGPVEAMRNICPLFSGVGVGMVLFSMMLSCYYSVVMSWAMLYLGSSFSSQLPWTHCNNTWNTEFCHQGSLPFPSRPDDNVVGVQRLVAVEVVNISSLNRTTPGQEFFDRRILQMTNGVTDMGDIHWELTVCLLIAWVLLYATIRKSVRWSGKMVYVTATLPYFLLLALTGRALTLEGADDGLRYFFHPDWSILLSSEVWVNALAQAFMSMGIAYGCLMAFASYNRFHNPLIRDALCLSMLNSLTSLIAGIIVFAALGHTAYVQSLPIDQAATDGLSLSLVMYSTVVSQMPFPQFWSVFLFVMLIFIGLDTQFATVEVVQLTLHRFFKQFCNKKSGLMPDLVVIGMCMVCFVGALPYITQVHYFPGGIYLMHLTDYYIATVAVTLLALIVAFSTGVLYGAGRLARNIREMTAHSPSPILIICWAALTPLIILGVCVFHLCDLKGLDYNHGTYVFPEWTVALGWSVVAFILVPVPLFGIVAISQASGKSIIQKIGNSLKSQIAECPCCRRGVHGLKDTHSMVHLDEDALGSPQTAYTFAEFAAVAYPDDGLHTVTSVSSLPFTPSTLNSPLTPTVAVHYPSDEDLHRLSNSVESRQHPPTD
ncbi:sodium- and chloride-dependent betaine transporter-like isoform X1 [Daphnia pulicaria]|uniref:sodium- and chloride-dependent betaine transporter-like isoform X1 n=1 Tax=Daphnia pulicaria TaxID=35523 RepID=UPI001EEA6CDB|nr:sodium- and chloride-dependent betaine transporter-like isoform X1 [Daphnia pulicaria]